VKSLIRLLAVAAALFVAQPAWTTPAWADDDSFKIDEVMGKADAPLTIIEYASTTCPHCAHFHKGVLPRLKAEWIDTGRAKLIYRDFPTGPQSLSVGASMIAHCAGPDRYFGLLGLIMDHQEKWIGADDKLAELKQLAKLAGMGGDKVDACLKQQDLADAITARAKAGYDRYGVDSTPSFVINGKVFDGVPQSFEEMDAALKKAAAK